MKRFYRALFCITIFLTSVSSVAFATPSDIKESAWYYNDVELLIDLGIIRGYPDGSFKHNNYVTEGEALAIIRNAIGDTKISSSSTSNHWASAALDRAVSNNIMPDFEEGRLDMPITRSKAFGLIANELAVLGLMNPYEVKPENKYVDLNGFEEYYKEIQALSLTGIIGGVQTPSGPQIKPFDNITRAELSKVVVSAMRFKEAPTDFTQYMDSASVPGVRLSALPNVKYSDYPDIIEGTAEEYEQVYKFMIRNGIYNFSWKNVAKQNFDQMTKRFYAAIDAVIKNNYHLAYHISFSYGTEDGYRYIRLTDVHKANYERTVAAVNAFTDRFKASWPNFDSLTDVEKMLAVAKYIVDNAEYDYSKAPESQYAYNIVEKGTAVCAGYTKLFNLTLLNLGIEATTKIGTIANVENSAHVWTKVKTPDGVRYIDSTWMDNPYAPGGYDMSYFLVTAEQLARTHVFVD